MIVKIIAAVRVLVIVMVMAVAVVIVMVFFIVIIVLVVVVVVVVVVVIVVVVGVLVIGKTIVIAMHNSAVLPRHPLAQRLQVVAANEVADDGSHTGLRCWQKQVNAPTAAHPV